MKHFLIIFVGLFFFAIIQTASAATIKTGSIYKGDTGREVSLSEIARAMPEGAITIVSEQHTYQPHHLNQIHFLQELAVSGAKRISVGMEFFAWSAQNFVDQFLAGSLGEADFLKKAHWGGNPFSDYRTQVLFPRDHGGHTLALNANQALVSRISRVGIAGLTLQEKSELPPGFTLGNAAYFARFSEVMKDHVSKAALNRYFEAQSVWDETMAWNALLDIQLHPSERMMIIVGDFHAAYGGGLPDRLRARGVKNLVTISQIDVQGLSPAEAERVVGPDPRWGVRADYIWVE